MAASYLGLLIHFVRACVSVLKNNEFHMCSTEEVHQGLCNPTGICDNTPMQVSVVIVVVYFGSSSSSGVELQL